MNAEIQVIKPDRLLPLRARTNARACAMIGQKLNVLFEVPSDTSSAIESLLRQLDGKLC